MDFAAADAHHQSAAGLLIDSADALDFLLGAFAVEQFIVDGTGGTRETFGHEVPTRALPDALVRISSFLPSGST